MSDDLISRRAVIDELNKRQRMLIYCFGFENDMVKIIDIAKKNVIAMPSTQQKTLKYSGDSICLYCMTDDCVGCIYEPMEGVANGGSL